MYLNYCLLWGKNKITNHWWPISSLIIVYIHYVQTLEFLATKAFLLLPCSAMAEGMMNIKRNHTVEQQCYCMKPGFDFLKQNNHHLELHTTNKNILNHRKILQLNALHLMQTTGFNFCNICNTKSIDSIQTPILVPQTLDL